MSDALIQAALEKRLQAMAPAISTAFENVTFQPVAGQPFQRVNFMPAEPASESIGCKLVEHSGLFQVSLRYPAGGGRGAAQVRAEAVRSQFKSPMTLTEGAVNVHINKPARISAGYQDGDRWVVPVTISWHAYIPN